jgi:phage tail P2-like protein
MTDCTFKSLLPRPGIAELALEHNMAGKYCRVNPAILRQLHDPMTCPVELLPWLAYALSVDIWNDDYPESTKRALCFNALQMHVFKGTLGGVEDAFAALGIRTEIVEWWQTEPKGEPGTVHYTLWLNENIMPSAEVMIGAELIRDILSQLNRSKRASIHYTFDLAVEMHTGFVVGYSGANQSAVTYMDAAHTDVTVETHTGFTAGFSAESSTLTYMDAAHTDVTIDTNTGFSTGFSMEYSSLTYLDAIL